MQSGADLYSVGHQFFISFFWQHFPQASLGGADLSVERQFKSCIENTFLFKEIKQFSTLSFIVFYCNHYFAFLSNFALFFFCAIPVFLRIPESGLYFSSFLLPPIFESSCLPLGAQKEKLRCATCLYLEKS